MDSNIMMDAQPLFPVPYHPWKMDWRRDFRGKVKSLTRTQKPVKYYLTDFGLSRRYNADDLNPLELPVHGGDKSVPEFKNYDTPHNPFLTDIYYLGNFMRMTFTQGNDLVEPYVGFDFLTPLITDMTQEDPKKRPTIGEVSLRFDELCKGLGFWKLRSRVPKLKESSSGGFGFFHWQRQVGYIIRGMPALPTPKEKKRKASLGADSSKGGETVISPQPAEGSSNKQTVG